MAPHLTSTSSAARCDLQRRGPGEPPLLGAAGGLGVAPARTFPILEGDVKDPQTEHWDRAIRIFDLLL